MHAWAAFAAAYTVLSCLGPRSRAARRGLNRAFSALAATPLTAAMAMLTLAVLAITIGSVILIKAPPPLWPVPGVHGLHIPGIAAVRFDG